MSEDATATAGPQMTSGGSPQHGICPEAFTLKQRATDDTIVREQHIRSCR